LAEFFAWIFEWNYKYNAEIAYKVKQENENEDPSEFLSGIEISLKSTKVHLNAYQNQDTKLIENLGSISNFVVQWPHNAKVKEYVYFLDKGNNYLKSRVICEENNIQSYIHSSD